MKTLAILAVLAIATTATAGEWQTTEKGQYRIQRQPATVIQPQPQTQAQPQMVLRRVWFPRLRFGPIFEAVPAPQPVQPMIFVPRCRICR